jgi:hypothetical protein
MLRRSFSKRSRESTVLSSTLLALSLLGAGFAFVQMQREASAPPPGCVLSVK